MAENESSPNVDYKKLMEAVFGAAVGDEEPTVREQVVVRRSEDGYARQVNTRSEPNVALAMKLLEDRIGGPQDYC